MDADFSRDGHDQLLAPVAEDIGDRDELAFERAHAILMDRVRTVGLPAGRRFSTHGVPVGFTFPLPAGAGPRPSYDPGCRP